MDKRLRNASHATSENRSCLQNWSRIAGGLLGCELLAAAKAEHIPEALT
jgi:hypothetical protein